MNIRDIARIANVTPGTVSKVLNNYPDISEATREQVRKVIEEYSYAPTMGKAANQPRFTTIGLVCEGVYNELFSEMRDILFTRFHNAGYTILSYDDNYHMQDKTEKFGEIIKYISDHSLTGLVYMGGNFLDVPKNVFLKLACPTVFVNTVLPDAFSQTNYSSVQTNNYECARHEMQLLIDKGHKHIAMVISSKDDNSIYGLRFEGFRAALTAAGLKNNLNNVIEGQYTLHKTYNDLKKHLSAHPEITAVCVNADIMVPAVLRAIIDAGKKPGEDIEVIGYDGLDLMDYLEPRVSGFAQPKHEMADAIYDLLLGLISNEKQHQHVIFQSRLNIRDSFK